MSSMIPTFHAFDEVVVTFRPIELCCPNCGRAAGHVYADHPITVPGVVLGPLPAHKPALCKACGHKWTMLTKGWYYVATSRGS